MFHSLKKYIQLLLFYSFVFSQPGILNVGFDIDDTVLYSEEAFQTYIKKNGYPINYGWINQNDKNFSLIEITENSLMDPDNAIQHHLKRLNALDIDIAIDDFGTGYSSLSILAKIPFNYLKIDKSFVFNSNTKDGFQVLQCIYNVAIGLGKKVIAEGVESEEHVKILQEMGVYLMQGYFFSKPKALSEIKE